MRPLKNLRERRIGAIGSVSGATSVLGSWQVCHNVCLGIVALLGIFGIAVAGMPLIFLTKLAMPFWIAAFILLLITIGFYIKKRCISKNLITFNSGLLVIGVPFKPVQSFIAIFWAVGGILVVISICFFIRERVKK